MLGNLGLQDQSDKERTIRGPFEEATSAIAAALFDAFDRGWYAWPQDALANGREG